VAGRHVISSAPGRKRLLHRLAENERVIREVQRRIIAYAREGGTLGGVAEWLLDNFYLIEEQIALARDVFPSGYSRELPRLRYGPLKGLPRVYDVVLEMVPGFPVPDGLSPGRRPSRVRLGFSVRRLTKDHRRGPSVPSSQGCEPGGQARRALVNPAN